MFVLQMGIISILQRQFFATLWVEVKNKWDLLKTHTDLNQIISEMVWIKSVWVALRREWGITIEGFRLRIGRGVVRQSNWR